MTITKDLKYSISEVLDILKHIDEEELRKIPIEVIIELNTNQDEDYESTIDYTKPLNEAKISQKALSLLAYIYREYLCDDVEKNEFDQRLYENQMQNAKKYNVEKVFESRKDEKNEFLPVVIVHESIFKKFINKVRQFLGI